MPYTHSKLDTLTFMCFLIVVSALLFIVEYDN